MTRNEAKKTTKDRMAKKALANANEALKSIFAFLTALLLSSVIILPHLLMVCEYADEVGIGWKIASGIWLGTPALAILSAMIYGLADCIKSKIKGYNVEEANKEKRK